MNRSLVDSLERIFSDARVVDIDFSKWYQHVSLVVLSDHYADWTREKTQWEGMPLLEIRLNNVKEFSVKNYNDAIDCANSNKNKVWHICESIINEATPNISMKLSGIQSSPTISIVCNSVDILVMSHWKIYTINPEWCRYGIDFARPSIDDLSEDFQNKRKT